MLLVGIGLGFSIQTQTLLVQSSVKQADVAIVSGLVQFWQSIGGGIGLAVYEECFLSYKFHPRLFLTLAKLG